MVYIWCEENMRKYILMQYFIQNILNGANYYNEMINIKLSNDEIINIDANMLIKYVSSYFNLDNFCHEIKDLKIDKLLYDSLKSEFEINDLGIKEKSITFEVGSYEYENISPCLNFDVYDISFYKRVLNLSKKMLKNFGK